MKAILRTVLLLASFMLGLQMAHAQPTPVPLAGYRVTDLTDTLSVTGVETLSHKVAGLEQLPGTQLRILLVSTLGDETIESYAKRVYADWRPGNAGSSDGLVFVMAKHERKMRLQVGTGLESALPPGASQEIIAAGTPLFKKGQFAQGLSAVVDATTARLAQSRAPVAPAVSVDATPQTLTTVPAPAEPAQDNSALVLVAGLVGAALVAFVFIRVRMARTKAREDRRQQELRRYSAMRDAEERAQQARRSAERERAARAEPPRAAPAASTGSTSARRRTPSPAPAPLATVASHDTGRRYREDDDIATRSSNDFATAAMLMAATSPSPAPAPTYYSPPPPPPAPAPSSWSRSNDDDSSSRSSSSSGGWGGSDGGGSSSSDTSSSSGDY